MALENDYPSPEEIDAECRDPTLTDLVELCAALNAQGAKYVVVGGFAVIQAGYDRHTKDIDLLVETSRANEDKLVRALRKLPERAIDGMQPGDIENLVVVRVADEIMVDLMKSGCGVAFADAIGDAVWREIDGVRIPFASKQTLWKMKQTLREKDAVDRLFLRRELQREGVPLDPPEIPRDQMAHIPRWIRRALEFVFGKSPDR
jgi:hypothetical protein